ncbi:WYL domain-containing protein [Arenibaculum pallidiluteum]|uniref:WYL domain-containing protein n=1 Tax=Arenibaculum pallidiluteum TaxID=2812559 RepID=UPI001A95FEA9|nr:WYL domain-containing protein [Arenibaculum pallidiluteum]
MGLFSAIARMFRRTDTTPPPMPPTFSPAGMHAPDEPELLIKLGVDDDDRLEQSGRRSGRAKLQAAPDVERIDDDLWGVTFAIEYRDGAGDETRRRITLRQLYRGAGGLFYLQAMCHERRALRTFRFDRICCVIDMDGVVHDPTKFFADELRFDVRGNAPAPVPRAKSLAADRATVPKRSLTPSMPPVPVEPEKPGYAHRRVARDGLRVLVALARSDGFLAPEEISVIVGYIAAKAHRSEIAVTDADVTALRGYLQRQYPSIDVLERCLDGLEQEPVEDQRLFLDSAVALMRADGEEHAAELAMLTELRDRLAVPA